MPEKTIEHYKNILENDFKNNFSDYGADKLHYLSNDFFDFTLYDSDADKHFAWTMLEVIRAIKNGRQGAFFKEDPSNYYAYLACVNHKFFDKKLEWGTSIRTAWFSYGDMALNENNYHTHAFNFPKEDLHLVIDALLKFSEDIINPFFDEDLIAILGERGYISRKATPMPDYVCPIYVLKKSENKWEEYLCEWVPTQALKAPEEASEGYLGTASVISGQFKGIGFHAWEQNNSEFIYYRLVE